MKEKSAILAVLLIAAMFTMMITSAVKAWEYSDTEA
jgi:p-aminobenzoyl-glutamate transporter AbgT